MSPLVEISLYIAALAGWFVVLAFGVVRVQIMWGAVCDLLYGKHKAPKVQRPDKDVASAARKRSTKKKRNSSLP